MGYIVDRPEGSSQLPGCLLIKPLVERLKDSSVRLLPGLVIFDLVAEEGAGSRSLWIFERWETLSDSIKGGYPFSRRSRGHLSQK